MWYTGAMDNPNFSNWTFRIGYAESNDGINWTKYVKNPVLEEGDYVTWGYDLMIHA